MKFQEGPHVKIKILVFAACAAAFGFQASAQNSQPSYTYTETGALTGGSYSVATNINDRGQVIGIGNVGPGRDKARDFWL